MTDNQPYIRIATREDIPVLAEHHRKMFEEIWEKKGVASDPAGLRALETAYAGKLSKEMKTGACTAWVAVTDDRIVASGAVSIVSYVPVPFDLSTKIAFLHSVYTEKEYRNRHYADRITQEAVGFCRSRGIKRLYLFASDDGRPVYEKNGFNPVENVMMKLVPDR
jgi:GNAT superfamily N-acetyltransferase